MELDQEVLILTLDVFIRAIFAVFFPVIDLFNDVLVA
jgi:hypothetical protein